jgi:hypothetical protein
MCGSMNPIGHLMTAVLLACAKIAFGSEIGGL